MFYRQKPIHSNPVRSFSLGALLVWDVLQFMYYNRGLPMNKLRASVGEKTSKNTFTKEKTWVEDQLPSVC